MKVRKAIIPAAGLGTRFLPATKAQPKEMLPVVDKPTIQYIIEEAVASGIEDIIIVTGRGKRAIEDHFDISYELEDLLTKKQKWKELDEVKRISEQANIHYIRQKEPKGLGHAIYCAKTFIGNEPFAVMLGDDIVYSLTPCLQQLVEVYEKYHSSVIGVQKVLPEEVQKYGIVDGEVYEDKKMIRVRSLIEKPSISNAPTNIAIMGRYILSPNIFPILGNLPPGANGEIQLTDALSILSKREMLLGLEFIGKRYDIGDKLGFLKANIEYSLRHPEMKGEIFPYLENLLGVEKLIK